MRKRLVVGDLDDLVDQAGVEDAAGTKPAPMPWILCGPGLPPDSTGESAGSTATIFRLGQPGLEHLAHAR